MLNRKTVPASDKRDYSGLLFNKNNKLAVLENFTYLCIICQKTTF